MLGCDRALTLPYPNLNQVANCLASLKPAYKCDLRFRVVVVLLLHATTLEARASLVKILGPVDFTRWLAVLQNPEVDTLLLVPLVDLVDAESSPGAAELAKFSTRKGVESRGTAWIRTMTVKDNPPPLERKFGPPILRTATFYFREKEREAAKKEAAKAQAARLERQEEAAAARAAAKEEKKAALQDAKEARQQVALTLTPQP
jgi:hypothetical protein